MIYRHENTLLVPTSFIAVGQQFSGLAALKKKTLLLRSHHQRCWCHYWGEDPSICILKNKSSQRFYTGRMQKPSLFLAVPWSLPLGVRRNWSREGLKTCWSSHSFLRWNQDTDSGQLWSHSPLVARAVNEAPIDVQCPAGTYCSFRLRKLLWCWHPGERHAISSREPKASAAYWGQCQKQEKGCFQVAGQTEHSILYSVLFCLSTFISINGLSEFTALFQWLSSRYSSLKSCLSNKQKESLRAHLKTLNTKFPQKHSFLPDSKVHENTNELEKIVPQF